MYSTGTKYPPPDSATIEAQEMPRPQGSLLTIAMYHHGETLQSN